jgi:hypothetical protein
MAAMILALCGVTNVASAAQEVFNVVNVGVDLSLNAMFVQVDHNSTSSTCATKFIFMWALSTSTREVLALATSALAAGKTVNIGVSEGGVCVNGYATGTWLRVDQ